jgi:EAL domain-containing protein (putative c-di-GMP-specific phosphodiesterase class I)
VGVYDYKSGYNFASEIIRRCSDIYYIDGYQIKVNVNIGISVLPYDATNRDELIKHADIAMTQARTQGLNTIQEFNLEISEVFLRRNTIELMLKKVNFAKEFIIYYQPQLETSTRKIIGFEALLRWRTGSGKFISPGEFIPIAEETGYIIQIGDWVTKEVLKQMIHWNRRFKETVMIGINVSLRQLNTAQFLESLREEIKKLEIEPEWIDLEITESLQLMENPEVLNVLEEIRLLGVKISIDDFGTGYSSLSYFKDLPADRIKLAKELIDFIHKDDFDYQLVKSMILLAHARNIRVIAEGVETIEQWESLKELQCDEVQGFYFGRPVSASEIEAAYGDELFGNF